MTAERRPAAQPPYRRDGFTWAAFALLTAFGILNAVLGPALPYLRAVEHTSYLVGSLHQVAFAVGGGVAGLAAARARPNLARPRAIRLGLLGAALAGLGLGYGERAVVTVTSALVVSLLGTSALVRLWAALADAHGGRRTVALTEGEVAVSLGGIIAPLLIGALASTTLSWRFAFVLNAALIGAAVVASGRVRVPVAGPPEPPTQRRSAVVSASRRRSPTLILVFAIVACEFSLSFWLASYLHDSVGLTRGRSATMVGGLYAANLVGRWGTSRLARRRTTTQLLIGAIITTLIALPILLLATDTVAAGIGIALAGIGIGTLFPLASSLHVGSAAARARSSDQPVGEVLAVAAIGQIVGPVSVAAIAQAAGLRIGFLVLPTLALLAVAALARLHCTTRLGGTP